MLVRAATVAQTADSPPVASQSEPQSSSTANAGSVNAGSVNAGLPSPGSVSSAAEVVGEAPGNPPVSSGFLADTAEELRKVVWPSRQQLFGESVAVILMVTLSAFAIAAIDRFYSWANGQVFR